MEKYIKLSSKHTMLVKGKLYLCNKISMALKVDLVNRNGDQLIYL